MKKTLVSALAGAFVVGATATTFAAANPFEDVPADHWAYDAVAQLAADGVIEGYGDGTYRGDQEITRYEMAQMVARAMARVGVGDGDKALIDRLAAEFADELNNLGVRVAALEKKVDNVKWTGRVRYRYIHRTEDRMGIHELENRNVNEVRLRLEPTARINDNWVGKARIDYANADNMDTGANTTGATVDRIYVEGTYGNTKIDLGKIPFATKADYGMVSDYRMAGAQVVFGKNVQVSLAAGRIEDAAVRPFNLNSSNARSQLSLFTGGTSSYQGIEVYNDRAQQFTWGVGFQRVKREDLLNFLLNASEINIWNVGLGYKFDKNVNLTGAYAQASGVSDTGALGKVDSKHKHSYAFQLNYKGAKAGEMGSWGAFFGYRHLGVLSTIHSTYREFGPMNGGEKGWEIGMSWTPMKNVLGKVQYYRGEELISENKVSAIWTELSFIF
ncbi:MAG: S-layer homology domain-containing protein [Schwartzia sp. (in: firmicutes)]